MKPESVSTKQERIAELARHNRALAFTSLNQYIDYEWVKYAYERTGKDAALGVDGQSAQDYALDLERNLCSLTERLKSGRYRAIAVRRHYIDKRDGGQRALGIPSFEDKVAQRAIVMLLEPIYEQDFRDCSYGFRPGRSAHQALRALSDGIWNGGGRWLLDVDVRKYFASIERAKLRECLARRVKDGVVRRLIDKWLKAGVLEAGQLHHPPTGTPEGGVISPLLANVFLHYVVDEWFAEQVQKRVHGPSSLVRYADDFIMLFTRRADAERVLDVLGKRLEKYGLQLHPDKTRVIDFRFKDRSPRVLADSGFPTSFNFLGFAHAWVITRKGKATVRQLMAKDRLARALKALGEQCRHMRHWSLPEQHARLCQMLRGYYAYFGIGGNARRLGHLRYHAERYWRKWLSRRSAKRRLGWVQFARLLKLFPLPAPRISHPYATS